MNQKDKDFLRSVMHERMTQHYADSFDPTGEKALEFAAVEQDLNQTLEQGLPVRTQRRTGRDVLRLRAAGWL